MQSYYSTAGLVNYFRVNYGQLCPRVSLRFNESLTRLLTIEDVECGIKLVTSVLKAQFRAQDGSE